MELTSSGGKRKPRGKALSSLQTGEEKLVISSLSGAPGSHICHLLVPSHTDDSGHLLRSKLMRVFFFFFPVT